jgi:hypothetical protein
MMSVNYRQQTVRPSGDDMHQVEELLDILAHTNIDGVGVTLNFTSKRIQRAKKGYTLRMSTRMKISSGRHPRG